MKKLIGVLGLVLFSLISFGQEPLKFCYTKHDKKSVRALGQKGSYWDNREPLKVFFWTDDEIFISNFKNVLSELKDVHKVNIDFEYTFNREESDIRIGNIEGIGSWSYVGNYARRISKDELTLNIGWYDPTFGVERHEIGHMLGFHHEHQHANRTFVLDTLAIYQDLQGSPNFWSIPQIDANIIDIIPLEQSDLFSFNAGSLMGYIMPDHWFKFGKGTSGSNEWTEDIIEALKQIYGSIEDEIDDPVVCNHIPDFLYQLYDRKYKLRVLSRSQLLLVANEFQIECDEDTLKRTVRKKLYEFLNL